MQERASNHLKLHWLRAIVVSVEESHGLGPWRGADQRDERKRTIDEVSKPYGGVKTGLLTKARDKFRGYLLTA